MTASQDLALLQGRIAREQTRLSGHLQFREHAIQEHAAFLAQSTEREATIAAELDALCGRLPEAIAAAEEEQRLADLAEAQAELDVLLEEERVQKAKRDRVKDLQRRVAKLDTIGSQP